MPFITMDTMETVVGMWVISAATAEGITVDTRLPLQPGDRSNHAMERTPDRRTLHF
jgi:hypothetical protein